MSRMECRRNGADADAVIEVSLRECKTDSYSNKLNQ